MDDDLTPLGALLEAAREHHPGLSQNAVGKAAGVTGNTYRRAIRGRVPVSPDTIARFADVLGVEPDMLERVGRADVAHELETLRNRRADDATHLAKLNAILVGAGQPPVTVEEMDRAARLVPDRNALAHGEPDPARAAITRIRQRVAELLELEMELSPEPRRRQLRAILDLYLPVAEEHDTRQDRA